MLPTNVSPTDDLRIHSLLSGYGKWAGSTISFSFATTDKPTPIGSLSTSEYANVSNSELKDFRQAFATWASYLGVSFVEVKDDTRGHGDIRVAFSPDLKAPYTSLAAYPGSGSDVKILLNISSVMMMDYYTQNEPYSAFLREIGHALGLKNPFEKTPLNTAILDGGYTTRTYTIMTDSWDSADGAGRASIFPTTPMPYDILVAQALYGANLKTNASDTRYVFEQDDIYFQTIYDAGGTNSFVYEGWDNVRIDLHEGAGSYVGIENWLQDTTKATDIWIPNVWIAFGTVIHEAYGGFGDDVLIANDHGNRLHGGFGNDILLGGAGIDTAIYEGPRENHTITKTSNGFNIVDNMSINGTDSLQNIERLQFSDTLIAIDTDGNAGKAYRLYQAAFDRTPDMKGLGYWINAMDHGQTIQEVAASFCDSREFKELYGNTPSHKELLTRYYGNVLHRAPDQGGFDYWLDILNKDLASPVQVLVNFSEGAENKAQVIGVIQNGIEYIPWIG